MIYAIISDIHSNLEALNAVLEKCTSAGVEKYICLGDIVGYNANPLECIEIVKKLPMHTIVKGNHDEYVGSDIRIDGINRYAKASIEWTKLQLSDEDRKWLCENKFKSINVKEGISIVHATLDSPESWNYIFGLQHTIGSFSYQMTHLCFYGHTHIPALFEKNPKISDVSHGIKKIIEWETVSASEEAVTFKYSKGMKYLINPGSIGQPRNGDSRASFAVLDTTETTITRYCVEYDIHSAQQKIHDAFLPDSLATRLSRGR